jgi:hypothetical protein
MKMNCSLKKIFVKLPVLLAILMAPVVQAQNNKTKSPPPPPPKTAAPAPKPAAPPPNNTNQTHTGSTTANSGPTANQPHTGPTANQPHTGPTANQPHTGPTTNQPHTGPTTTNQPHPGPTTGQPHTGPTTTNQPHPGPTTNPHAGPTGANTHGANTNSHTVQTHAGPTTVMHASPGHTTIHTANGVTINRNARGGRVVETRVTNGRIVSVGRNNGFRERTLVSRPGYVQRTYVVNGRTSVRIYRGYSYRGIGYNRYVPGYYYGPRFYGWAYNPWPGRVYYGWGWGTPVWFYGGYFAPAPFYPAASLWLADFMLSADLQAAYDAQAEANGDGGGQAPPQSGGGVDSQNQVALSPAVRQAIADEVQRQLDAERAAAMNPQEGSQTPTGDQLPPALNPENKIFVVNTSLDVADGTKPCELTAGDVISRVDDDPDADKSVRVAVVASKGADCRLGSTPKIEVSALQEMQNEMQAQMDAGLQRLASEQGKNGLPPAQDATAHANKEGTGVADTDALTQIQNQQQDANQTEKEVKQSGQGGQGGNDEQPTGENLRPAPAPLHNAAAVVSPGLFKAKSLVLKAIH